MKIIKVTRTLVYEGKEDWVRNTLVQSYIQPARPMSLPYGSITELERTLEEEVKDG